MDYLYVLCSFLLEKIPFAEFVKSLIGIKWSKMGMEQEWKLLGLPNLPQLFIM